MIVSLWKPHHFSDGDMVRLYLDKNPVELPVKVISEIDILIEGINYKPEFVFVYGRQVNDFRSLDYDQVFIMGVGAIQEQQKMIESLKAENYRLKINWSSAVLINFKNSWESVR